MKSSNKEFHQLINIANKQCSKDLFMNFVKNDPDFKQVVDRDQFISSMMSNSQFNLYRLDADDHTRKNIGLLLSQLFDLLETP